MLARRLDPQDHQGRAPGRTESPHTRSLVFQRGQRMGRVAFFEVDGDPRDERGECVPLMVVVL